MSCHILAYHSQESHSCPFNNYGAATERWQGGSTQLQHQWSRMAVGGVRLPHGVQKPLCGPLNSPSHQDHDQEHEHELYMHHPASKMSGRPTWCMEVWRIAHLVLQEDASAFPRCLICCNHLTLPLILYMTPLASLYQLQVRKCQITQAP